jgi:3-oxoacyl-[acyl-carrier-protein] synthase III
MTPPPGAPKRVGVRIAGTGSFLPSKRLTNTDLEKLMDTTDKWIVQRTGIRERRLVSDGESVSTMSAEALRKALAAARLAPTDLDLIICATMTGEMPCPPSASLVANLLGTGHAGAFDLNGACCGFVFGLNTVHELIKGGLYRTVGLVGADALSIHMNYSTAGRGTAILFGDGAGAVVLRATDDTGLGLLAQSMHAEGKGWKDIYIPMRDRDFPAGVTPDPQAINRVQMNGAAVFKFAVGTFPNLIQETLDKARIGADQVDMYICHQSNARILQSARERFGIPADKLYVNIDRVGNTVGASVPLCLDELVAQGRVKPGMKVMFVAFGGGLTWGSSLWQL